MRNSLVGAILSVLVLIATLSTAVLGMSQRATVRHDRRAALEATRALLRDTNPGDVLLIDLATSTTNETGPIPTRAFLLAELYAATLGDLRAEFLVLYDLEAGPLESRARVLSFEDESLMDCHNKILRARVLRRGTPEWQDKINAVKTR